MSRFTSERLSPFTTLWPRYPATGAPDEAGWERAEDKLLTAVHALLKELDDLNVRFVDAGQKDLR
ncbi:hypothetical protein [Nocardia xishanensis]|uniref:hypothetical protein n=1 Tax=Nocardia xishanensis TaxID=238964 RepID=UPI000836F923|nr:hypothetical protein [Nocardia xishanensis]